MPFPFSAVCTLLSRYEEIELRDPPFLRHVERNAALRAVTEAWFKSHRRAINKLCPAGSVALLSALFPEKRADRVYGLQTTTLCRLLSRSMGLSTRRNRDLHAYTQLGKGDLATCLERILASGGPPALPNVTLEEVDDVFRDLASGCRFSDQSKISLAHGSSEAREVLIGGLLKRMQPDEGKWLARLLLKDLSPARIDEHRILHSFHFLLPALLRFQNDVSAAVDLLKGPLGEYPNNPDVRSEALLRQSAAKLLKPCVGVKVGRPTYHKARTIDHCIGLIGSRKCVLERKYDGEYCEIHIDMGRSSEPLECITIFSKSGKNSTRDRGRLLPALVDCFRLKQRERKISRQAIILGELVVYSDHTQAVLPFDNIRKHVTRSGSYIGTKADSVPHGEEHLAVVFFDILLWDDRLTMNESVEVRRSCLRKLYQKAEGLVMGAEWKIVDFNDAEQAKRRLAQQFAASIAQRCEGLVLKPCGSPYFPLDEDDGYIKMKKDYIDGLGDEADFAVIGASCNAQQALKFAGTGFHWTVFHLACLVNKPDVLRTHARPRYKLVGSVSQAFCIPKPALKAANILGQSMAEPYECDKQPTAFDLELIGDQKIDVTFREPFVVEVLGSGFSRPPDSGFQMLRHPRVRKLHRDRTWRDCVSFQELQEQAAVALACPIQSESQETRRWLSKLADKARKKFDRERTISPRTRRSVTPSTTSTSAQSNRDRCIKGDIRVLSEPYPHDKSTLQDVALDTSTSIDPTSRGTKRKWNDETIPRHTTKGQVVVHEVGVRSKRPRAKHKDGTGTPLPLTDITNSASKTSSSRGSLRNGLPETCEHRDVFAYALQEPRDSMHSYNDEVIGVQMGPQCEPMECRASACLFNNSAVFLSGCIAQTPYIAHDLLRIHDVILVTSLDHWDRAALAHGDLNAIVSESQAYIGMRKVVLVEMKRRRSARDMVRHILWLNKGRCRDRIEVYDWRVLECCLDHKLGAAGEEAKSHFLGATIFDEGCAKARFVTCLAWSDAE